MAPDDVPRWQIDCRGMPAPYPMLGARAALAMMDEGDVLALLVTDCDTIADLPAWCRMTGNRLVAVTERRGVHCMVVRKGCAHRELLAGGEPAPAASGLPNEPDTVRNVSGVSSTSSAR